MTYWNRTKITEKRFPPLLNFRQNGTGDPAATLTDNGRRSTLAAAQSGMCQSTGLCREEVTD